MLKKGIITKSSNSRELGFSSLLLVPFKEIILMLSK